MAFKRLFPLQIAQDGATNNQVLAWNGSKWTPSSLSNIGGTSIYTGSGTIGNNVAGSTTNATLPSGNTAFNFRYFGGNNGFTVQGNGVNSGTLHLKNLANTFGLQVNDLDMALIYPNGSTTFESGKMTINDTTVFLDTIGNSPDPNALLEISSTTKVFFPPRMDTTQRNTIGAVSDGAIVYNVQSDTLDLRSNGAWVSLMDNNSIITASNGLTKNVNDIQLGGVLTQNTDINNNNLYALTVSGELSSDFLLTVTNDGGTAGAIKGDSPSGGAGLYGMSDGGAGVEAHSLSGAAALIAETSSSATNTAVTAAKVIRNVTSGAGADGVGSAIEMAAETSTTAGVTANKLISQWSTAAHATRSSKFSITSVNSSVESTSLEIAATGAIKMNKYGDGTFTGTPTRILTVDTDGNVIESTLSSVGGIYGGSGNIGQGVLGSFTNADVPTSGAFYIRWPNLATAFRVDSTGPFTTLSSSNTQNYLEITDTNVVIKRNTRHFEMGNDGFYMNFRTLIDDVSGGVGSVNSSAVLDVASVTKGLLVPRMDTTQQNNIVTPANGLHIYNTTLAKHSFRENGAWVQYMVDSAGVGGIYKGSGTIASACISTATVNSYWRVKYAGTAGTAILVDSTTGSELIELKGKDSGSYGGLTLDTDSAFLYEASSSQGVFVTDSLTQITSDWTELAGIAQASNVVTPATFGVAQHNYNTQNAVFLRLETTVNDTQITGFAHGKGLTNFADAGGRIMWITNIGAANQIRVMGNNAGSDAEYRIISTRIIAAGETHGLWYDPTAQRWRWLQGA